MVKLCSYAARNSRFWTSSAVVERKSTCTKSSLLPSLFWPAKTCTYHIQGWVKVVLACLSNLFLQLWVASVYIIWQESGYFCVSLTYTCDCLFINADFHFCIFIWPMGREHFNLATCMCTQGRNSASSYTYVFHDGVLQTAGGQTYVVCV